MTPRSVTTYYLEMTDPSAYQPTLAPREGLAAHRVVVPMPELNRFFYTAIGGGWFWIDRLAWDYERWKTYLERPELETWIFTVDGIPAGYTELERQPGPDVEIVYFGLLPAYVGRGLGGWALSKTIELAWAMQPRRVWVHTCNLDHPKALANYIARGFHQYKEETKIEQLPDITPGPW